MADKEEMDQAQDLEEDIQLVDFSQTAKAKKKKKKVAKKAKTCN